MQMGSKCLQILQNAILIAKNESAMQNAPRNSMPTSLAAVQSTKICIQETCSMQMGSKCLQILENAILVAKNESVMQNAPRNSMPTSSSCYCCSLDPDYPANCTALKPTKLTKPTKPTKPTGITRDA